MKVFWKILLVLSIVMFIAGICLAGIGFASGGGFDRASYREEFFSDTYNGFDANEISSIQIRVGAARVTVLEGDEFRVETKNIDARSMSALVENGVLSIEEHYGDTIGFPTLFRWLRNRFEPSVTVYYPAGFVFENADIGVRAGFCYISSLESGYLTVNINAGELLIEQVRAGKLTASVLTGRLRTETASADSVEVSVDAGSVELCGIRTDDCSISVDVGNALMSGEIRRSGRFETDLGSILVELEGHEDDYAISANVDLGNIIVDGRSYPVGGNHVTSGGIPLTLNCSLGQIEVSFN